MIRKIILLTACAVLLCGVVQASSCPYINSNAGGEPTPIEFVTIPGVTDCAITSTGSLPSGITWPSFPAPAGSPSGGLIVLPGYTVPGQINTYSGPISARAYELRPVPGLLSPLSTKK